MGSMSWKNSNCIKNNTKNYTKRYSRRIQDKYIYTLYMGLLLAGSKYNG
ncbi:MAG: hypothetical protein QM536_02645 [Chitinophagaceae bacterium]|nr:hypothetical protein [Chitinophagaceae bacterium]